MKKLNGYASILTSFIAGYALMSGHEHNVLLCVAGLILTVFVANDWGFGGVDEDGQVDRVSSPVRSRSKKKGA